MPDGLGEGQMNGALEAAAWGAVAASSLVIGGVLALRFRPSNRIVGLVLAFGAGALISSVAYELVPAEAVDAAGVGIALGLGAVAFWAGNRFVSRMGGEQRKDLDADEAKSSGSGPAIVLGTILDGVPESLVLGIGIAVGGGVSVAFLGAVFISNLPEAIAATVSLRASGRTRSSIMWMWVAIAALSAVAAAVGYVVASAIGSTGYLVEAFAAGALLTMIIDTMAPESVEEAGGEAGLATILGFALAASLSGME
jgi:zinc transporter, ZIP family